MGGVRGVGPVSIDVMHDAPGGLKDVVTAIPDVDAEPPDLGRNRHVAAVSEEGLVHFVRIRLQRCKWHADGHPAQIRVRGVDGGLRLDGQLRVRLREFEVVDVIEPVVAKMLKPHGRIDLEQEELKTGLVVRRRPKADLVVAVPHGSPIKVLRAMEDSKSHEVYSSVLGTATAVVAAAAGLLRSRRCDTHRAAGRSCFPPR